MEINISSNSGIYDVVIKKGCFLDCKELLNLNRKVLIVTDSNIPTSYVNHLLSSCKEGYVFTFKAGEKRKNLKTLKKILKTLLDHDFSRKDVVVALGGGVSGDMGAFSASIYKRGIEFYNIPTSLLSMIDSSIGGKTGIDFNGIKNSIGSFYPPKKVLVDPNLLVTLPSREFNAGLVEAIKMAATFDSKLFNDINKSKDIHKDIEDIIIRSLQIKADVVMKDEKESGPRQVLNFGHTVGHAIESYYMGKYLHGECVGMGMTYFASKEVKEKIFEVLNKYDLPIKVKYNKNKIIDILRKDKKSDDSYINCIYCKKLGSYEIKKLELKEIKDLL